jgi:hypothetical protein
MNRRTLPSGISVTVSLVLFMALAGACNSTTRLRADGLRKPSLVGSATGAGTGDTSEGSSVPAGAAAGPGSSGTSAAGTRGGAGAASSRSSGATSAGGAGASAGRLGQGITDKTIKIGIEVNKPINYGAFGGKGTSTDQVPPTKAVVAYINAHGGIAGRQVVPVCHSIDVTTGTFAEQAQTACTDLAEDNQVFLALSITDGIPDPACYAAHDVPYLDQRRFLSTESDLARYPDDFYFVSRLVSGERWGRAWIDGLAAQHFFDGPVKLGIFRYDGPVWQEFMADVIRPSLAAHHVEIVDEEAGPAPGSAADLSGLAAPIGNAILRFRSLGVNRVIFVETGGAAPFLFMPAAESQGFRPRYGLDSMNALYFLQQNDPATQLHGSVGVGWYPSDDTNGAYRTGTPTEQTCLGLMHEVGLTDPDLAETMGYCDTLFLVKQALDTAPALNVSGLRAAIEHLGTSYVPASTFGARFGPDRHEQAAMGQTIAFDDGCACFRFTGGTIPMP